MSQHLLTQIDYSSNFKQTVLVAFTKALRELVSIKDLPTAENRINRLLFRLVKIASQYDVWDLFCEANNLPDLDSEEQEARENKRPDFTCSYKDTLEEDPLKNTKTFIVECKRLGSAKINSLSLIELYVSKGILRFIKKEHGYGQSNPCGAMVGYIQDMEFEDILIKVNEVGINHNISKLEANAQGWRSSDVTTLLHLLNRPEMKPSQFDLCHLWVDVRSPKRRSRAKVSATAPSKERK